MFPPLTPANDSDTEPDLVNSNIEAPDPQNLEGKYFWGANIYYEQFQSPFVEILVGPIPTTFLCHIGILIKSSFFARAFSGYFKESNEQRIKLPEEDPLIFSSVLEYLYCDEYSPRIVTRLSNLPKPLSAPFVDNLPFNPALFRAGLTTMADLERARSPPPEKILTQVPITSRSMPLRELEGYDGSEDAVQQCAAAMRHAKIYCLADKLGIDGLQTLVLEKLTLCGPIKNVWFVRVAAYLVENSSDVQGQLTEFLTPFVPGIPGPEVVGGRG